MSSNPADAPNGTPPRWLNWFMIVMLKTPGVQRIVGKSTALITFEGRKSGRMITSPISYLDLGDRIVVAGHRTRQWWRNLEANPKVHVRLAGKTLDGAASVMADPDDALADYVAYIEAQPMVAKIAGIRLDDNGKADVAAARNALDYTVVVSIKLEGASD